jgi:three-Cys-motif partner protein
VLSAADCLVALRRPADLGPPPRDGLPTRDIAGHSTQKTHYWCKFSEAASTAVKDKFDARVCIDLFAAYGICEHRETKALSWGSALLSLQVTNPFDLYVLNDINAEATDALLARANNLGIPGASLHTLDLDDSGALARARQIGELLTPFGPKVVITRGDANKAPLFIKALLPKVRRRYVLALIDPPHACFDWQAFEALSFGEPAFDALVLFPDAIDFQRSISHAIHHPDSKVATRFHAFFGTSAWREIVLANPKHAESDLHRFYEERMGKFLNLHLGHAKGVGPGRRPLYHLVFGSKSKFGVNLWNSVTRRTSAEQDELFLGS